MKYAKHDLQMWSRHLDYYTSITLDALEDRDTDVSLMNSPVVESIQDWSQVGTSTSLWVQGPYEDVCPSTTSSVAGNVASMAIAAKLPVLCFFCDLSDYRVAGSGRDNTDSEDEEDDKEDNEVDKPEVLALMDLVYSLIRQSIDLLPTQVTTRSDFSKSSFARLNGSLKSFDKALNIIQNLIPLAPKALMIIIDGIEQFDDTNEEDSINNLLELLQEMMIETLSMEKKNRQTIKILYTTAGPCDPLESLDEEYLENIEAEEGNLRAELELEF